MRHIHPILATLALTALLATASLVACGKDDPSPTPTPQPALPTLESLTGTSWEGHHDTDVTYQGQPLTMRLIWSMDFLSDTEGSLLAEISSPASETQYQDIDFRYSVEGTVGHIYVGGEEDTFAIDAVNQTITIDMQLPINLGDEGSGQTLLGGVTVLYRTR